MDFEAGFAALTGPAWRSRLQETGALEDKPDQNARRRAVKRVAIVTAFPFTASWFFLGAVPQLVVASGNHGDARTIAAAAFGGVALAELAAVGLVARWLHEESRSFADLGWRRPGTPAAYVVALAVGAVFAASTLPFGFIQHNAHPDLGELSVFRLWSVVTAAGVIAICEEILFRGFAFDQLRSAGFGTGGQVGISSVAFGSFHGFFVLQAAVLGAVWGVAYLIGRRSLTPVIAGHAMNNLIAEPWFFLAIVSVQLN
jgi:membrane protease YdiL (CAAX protease family)